MGLKDQSLALRWVSKNIRYFGGDPKRITLAGDSAGGASVHHHYLSPLSAGLFQNGISFSGTALGRWAFVSDTSNITRALAKAYDSGSLKTIQCLKNTSVTDILKKVENLSPNLHRSYAIFSPVAEKDDNNYFINDTPANIIEQGRASDVPWIAGIVSEDGLLMTAPFALNEDMLEKTDKNWEFVAPNMLYFENHVPEDKYVELAKSAKAHYFGNEHFSTNRNSVKNLTHMIGDTLSITGAIRAAKLLARVNKSPVRLYYYTYRAAQSFSDELSNTTENLGVCHVDDVLLVLDSNHNHIDPTTTASDRAMQQNMLDFWESLASTRSPDLGTQWPRLNASSSDFEYMNIAGPGNFKTKTNNNLGEIHFWDQIGL